MEKIDILKRIIKEFHNRGIPSFKKRDIKTLENINKIISIIGPRRAGKTYFLYQHMDSLIKKGVPLEHILYINFEDERLSFFENWDYDNIFISYKSLYPEVKDEEIYIFFDEIQNLKNWEKFIRRVYDTKTKNIFITGSNTYLLSSEIATSLRGRTLSIEVLPLSFKEFLSFKEIEPELYTTNGIATLERVFEEFLVWGGYPELIGYSYDIRLRILQEYFNVMIYKDLIERYNIGDVHIIKYLLKRIYSSFTKEFSVNKLYNELKSRGFAITKDKIYNYIHYIRNGYFAKIVEKYNPSIVKQELGTKKIYLFDNGMYSANTVRLETNKGKLLENLIFIELHRRYKDIFFYKNRFECDFIILDAKEALAIQATYLLTPENMEREIKGIYKVLKRFPKIKNGIIIAHKIQENLDLPKLDKNIKIVNAIKWMLNFPENKESLF